MQIHELAALGRTPTTGDSLAIDTGSATVKIDYAALATAILDKLGAGSDGVVDIAHGGTNATTAADARTSLGITPANIGAVAASSIIDIAHGGTGESTAVEARAALGAAASAELADAYDDNGTYDVGDLCIYDNTLYVCITPITTAEAWTAAHWAATTLNDVVLKYSDVVTHTAGTTVKCRRFGSVVSLTIGNAVTVGTDGVFYTIDEAFRPVENTYFFVTDAGSASTSYLAVVKTNGDVAVYNRGDRLDYLYGSVTYIK